MQVMLFIEVHTRRVRTLFFLGPTCSHESGSTSSELSSNDTSSVVRPLTASGPCKKYQYFVKHIRTLLIKLGPCKTNQDLINLIRTLQNLLGPYKTYQGLVSLTRPCKTNQDLVKHIRPVYTHPETKHRAVIEQHCIPVNTGARRLRTL